MLTGYHDEDLGSYLTVGYTTDGDTYRPLFAGDAGHLLTAYAASIHDRLGSGPYEGEPFEQARAALEDVAERHADEWADEACRDWCDPDPDTSRSIRSMSYTTRKNLNKTAEKVGHEEAAKELDDFMIGALFAQTEPAPTATVATSWTADGPTRLAA